MLYKSQNEYLTKLADRLSPKLQTIEGVLAVISLIGLALKSSGIPLGGTLLVLSLSSLAIVYFLTAYRSFETDAPIIKRFIIKLIPWASSIGVIGILYRLNSYPGYNTMLTVGCMSLFIGLIIKFFAKIVLDKKVIIRTLIILAVGLLLYFTPSEKLKELKIISSIEKVSPD